MAALPLIFYHLGAQPCLDFAIAQGRHAHSAGRVILIGDHTNAGKTGVEHIRAIDYFEEAERFADIYQHRSTNPYKFELRCFQRWYVLFEVMQKNHMEEALMCDSDTMLFHDFSSLCQENPSAICGLSMVKNQDNFTWAACPHVAYWRLEALRDFCSFNTRLFKKQDSRLDEKWRYHRKQNISGGICDMTALYLFFSKLDPASKINFLEVKDQAVVDLAIGTPYNYLPEEFLMRDGLKRVFFRDGLPRGFHLPTQSEVRFKALHCQGNNKWLMPRLCQARNRMAVSRFHVFLRYGLRHLRHRLLKTVR